MNTDAARVQMVSQQVRTWDVLDPRVLETMNMVDRSAFVPTRYANVAFADSRIPLAHDQVMLAPKVVGRILQALTLKSGDQVLEIGTGSGYLTACLASLARSVVSIDIHADLTEQAATNLSEAGYANVELRTQDAFEFSSSDQYDAIVLTGSLPVYDTRFERLLKVGGRLYAAVGRSPVMDARIVTRAAEEEWLTSSEFETDVPALLNAANPVEFSF
ncbi:MAG: protein-L-isoaspartate O-methyltransferase [Gammaproteobacteria bacterium]